MRKLTDKQTKRFCKKLATVNFLKDLTILARIYGWSGDYTEIILFLTWAYNQQGIEGNNIPDLAPYEIDDNGKIIIK